LPAAIAAVSAGISPAGAPRLWSHQAEAVTALLSKAETHGGAVLDMPMGCGKTRVMLTLMGLSMTAARQAPGRYLIVCPNSAAPVWETEARKYLRPELNWEHVRRPPSTSVTNHARQLTGRFSDAEHLIVTTSYTALLNDTLRGVLQSQDWDIIVCDESHKLINSRRGGSQIAAIAASRKWKAGQKYAISGTTHPRSLLELHGQVRFAAPGVLPQQWDAFISRYATVSTSQGQQPGSVVLRTEPDWPWRKTLATPTEEYKQMLADPDSPLHVTPPAEQLVDLPSVRHIRVPCEMSPDAARIYTQLDRTGTATLPGGEEVRTSLPGRKPWTAAALLQVASGGLRGWRDSQPGKHETLTRLLETLPARDKVVVFCWWQGDHSRILAGTHKHGAALSVSGSVPTTKRAEIVRAWSKPAGPRVLAFSPAVAEGVDLTAARHAVFLSLPWQPHTLSQSQARLRRAGQQHRTIFWYLLSTIAGEPTIDDAQLDLLVRYRQHTARETLPHPAGSDAQLVFA